ncbi:MAG: hypothetical protein KGL94_09540 [Acidobacteriota bacterium]|nr:hypothetical protein [Acidobacteriota bacterium]
MATAAFRRFSWSSNGRTIVLGLAAAGAVTAAIVVSLPHHESARRRALVAYIKNVDAVEGRMNYSLTKVFAAYQAFSHSKTVSAKTRSDLAQAETTLTILRGRIAAIPAPRDAAHLRADVLRLVGGEAAITREVYLLARFSPSFSALLARLHTAAATLGRTLATIRPPTPHTIRGTKKQIAEAQAAFTTASDQAAAAQADAVTAYDTVVSRVRARMERLSAPHVLAPALRGEMNSLTATERAGARLAAALRQKKRSHVPQLARAFTIATRSSQTVAAQEAEIAAVKAYDVRVRHLAADAAAIPREITQLQQSVR